jgi:uncharacterized protein (TIRG00374 family)
VILSAVGLFTRTLARADLADVAHAIRSIGPRVALVLIPYALLLACETAGWRRLFSLLGTRVRFASLYAVRATCTGVCAVLPMGAIAGEGVKPLLVRRATGVRVTTTAATLAGAKAMLVSTQSIHFAWVTVAAWPTLIVVGERLAIGRSLPFIFVGASTMLALLAFALVILAARADVAQKFFRALSSLPLPPLRRLLARTRCGFLATDANLARLFTSPRRSLARAALPYLASWFCEALESFVILRLLGVHLAFFDVAALDAAVSLVRSFAFIAPSGLGVTDALYVAMLGAFGVRDASVAGAAFVVLKRGKELCWIAFGMAAFSLRSSAPPPSRNLEPPPASSPASSPVDAAS